jgi:hypothetical protein
LKLISLLFDILIPRFVTDYYAANFDEECRAHILHPLNEFPEKPSKDYDVVMEIKCFNLFGFGLFNTVYLWVEDNE